MQRAIALFASLALILTTGHFEEPASAQENHTAPTPDPDRIAADVYYLASDELEGRLTGTPGCEAAAEYIANAFSSIGLLPADTTPAVDGDYYQEFEITTGVSLGTGNHLEIITPEETHQLTIERHFIPLFFSANGSVEGEVVFAGYGITAPEYGWDDYADLDVAGKIVFCLRGEPRQDDPESPFDGARPTEYSGLRWKTFNAQSHGAAALIVATGPANLAEGEEDELTPLFALDRPGAFGESGIPAIQINQEAAELLWTTPAVMDTPLEMYQADPAVMDRHMMAFGTPLEPRRNVSVSLRVDLLKRRATTWNVAGILPGCDSELSDEFVIVGAHYDHIGWGAFGSLYEGNEPQIHNGADDNASGTAGVLELARLFAQSPDRPARSILFICFSAEELGILGSNAYVDNPLVPLEKTSAMINMDMIGRVRADENGTPVCTIQGLGSAVEWKDLVPEVTPDGAVALRSSANPIGGSDYTPFYLAQVPVLNFFSGVHDDYNRPTDDPELINYEGEASVLGGVYRIAEEVANLPGLLTYQECSVPAGMGSGDVDVTDRREVYLGTVPDFARTEGGFWISAVREGSPADQAGLQGGDRILKVGEFEIANIYDYTYALGQYKPGDTVVIVVLRDDEELTLAATFGSRDNNE